MATQRPNGLSSDYAYNPAGHLRRVRHRAGSSLRGQFNYTVDGRGNRTRAFERLAQSTTVTATYNKSATQVTFTRGTWTDAGDFKQTAQFSGRMQIAYTGDEALLTIGTGPDHGMIDISINDNYWRRFDAYTAQPGERVLHLPAVPTPPGATSGVIEIRNRSDRHHRSTGRVFRFKQLAVIDTTYTDTTIDYAYDALSRLTQADYDDGTTVYDYAYDLAGNLTNNNGKTRTYNATNQLTNDGTNVLTYDPNGNLTNDGTNSYTWDHTNRMLTAPNNTSYTYDGLGNRISQSIGTTATNYLLDLQPGLTKVIAATTETNANHYIHAPRGIHAQYDGTDWQYITQDGLGSVRSLIDATLNVSSVQNYAPYGEPFGTVGNFDTPFAFTGEQTDPNDLLFLRARYYNPSLGVFPSLDPFEGTMARPMSLNRYSWVEGNPIMNIDPTGHQVDCPARGIEPGAGNYGGSRWSQCEILFDVLANGGTPTWGQVYACYPCVLDISSLPTIEAYSAALEQALIDEYASRESIDRAIASFEGYDTQIVPEDIFWGNEGYLEGIGGGVGVIGGLQIGREIVYNFSTFQRSTFAYSGHGWTLLTGGYSAYYGGVEGFVEEVPSKFEGGAFFGQYSGNFTVRPTGFGIPNTPLGYGGTYFWGQDGKYPGVSGNTVYIGSGKSWGVDAGQWTLTYWPQGDRKSYINRDCKVKIDELRDDIQYGYGSPIGGTGSQIILNAARTIAIRIAESKAIAFDRKYGGDPCSCKLDV